MTTADNNRAFETSHKIELLKEWDRPVLKILDIEETMSGASLGMESENAANMFS